MMRNRPAASLWHEGFQANYFVFDPLGLGLGKDPAA
jgi:hypothetical protein